MSSIPFTAAIVAKISTDEIGSEKLVKTTVQGVEVVMPPQMPFPDDIRSIANLAENISQGPLHQR